jgi:hypothetical protein
VKTTADLTTLHELAVGCLRPHLQPALWTEGTKYCSQAIYLVRPLQGSRLKRTAHKTRESKKKKKTSSSHIYPKLSNKRVSSFPTKPRIPSTNTRIGCQRNKSRTFTKRMKFLLLYLLFFSVLLTSPSLFSYAYSYPLHFPSFSCATIYCSPSQLLLLPLLIHSLPLSFPNLSPHYPTLLHTHHLLTGLLYQLYTPPDPCNP